MTFKPLLAATADPERLTFPLIASPKIDGIRCILHPELGPVTRSLKPIPNFSVRAQLSEILLRNRQAAWLDGELVTYSDGQIDDFNTIQSKIMRLEGNADFCFHVFDNCHTPKAPYSARLVALEDLPPNPLMHVVPTQTIHDMPQLAAIETAFVDQEGWEGVMLRAPNGKYKFGRSTVNEGILLKVKRFQDDEAIVTGILERMHNTNEPFKDALGRTQRSSAKSGLVGMNTLGALVVSWADLSFEIGTGFDDKTRQDLWSKRDRVIGSKVTFKYQGTGANGRPRFPVFLGLRSDV